MKCRSCDKPATVDFFGMQFCEECVEKPIDGKGCLEMTIRLGVGLVFFGILLWFLAGMACG